METILIGIFIVGYLLITLEHSLKIDKLIPALAMMAFLWGIIAVFNIPVFEVDTALRELIPVKVKKNHGISPITYLGNLNISIGCYDDS
jgi:hypothetical protein